MIETKRKGLFGFPEVAKYGRYKQLAEAKGFHYLFITGSETYPPYRNGIIEVLGAENSFFLDRNGHWQQFITRILALSQ